jgi:DNA-binding NtrC family response regulator
MLEILVVVADGVERLGIVQSLGAAGYGVRGASTFDEAKRLLTGMSPDLVMADERLGAYNGLHVLLRARAENPQVGAIVISPFRQRALEAEAKRLNVECVVKLKDATKWPALVSRTLDTDCGLEVMNYLGGSASNRSFLPAPTS